MSPTLAIIPAKRESQGVPGKNWRPLPPRGHSCTDLAVQVGQAVCDRAVLTTDAVFPSCFSPRLSVLLRSDDLCQPDTPMLAVVQDVLQRVPGPSDEIVVLLQPTSPLRTADTVRQAIARLQADPSASAVVSVQRAAPAAWALTVGAGNVLRPADPHYQTLADVPTRRQDCPPTYQRDGVVYACRRQTLAGGSLYGARPLAFFSPEAESLSIDTPDDWDEAVRRIAAHWLPVSTLAARLGISRQRAYYLIARLPDSDVVRPDAGGCLVSVSAVDRLYRHPHRRKTK